MILLLGFIRSHSKYAIPDVAMSKLATATTVAAQINLVMLFSDLVFEFRFPTHHSLSARYLFFGLGEHNALVPWIRTAIALNVMATIVLMIHPLRRNPRWLIPACATLFVGIWIEKGIGLVIPGFIPSPLGEIVEYTPTWVELCVTAGIWALGLFVLTVLVRVALPIELGEVRSPYLEVPPAARAVRPRSTRPQVRGRPPGADPVILGLAPRQPTLLPQGDGHDQTQAKRHPIFVRRSRRRAHWGGRAGRRTVPRGHRPAAGGRGGPGLGGAPRGLDQVHRPVGEGGAAAARAATGACGARGTSPSCRSSTGWPTSSTNGSGPRRSAPNRA